MKRKPKGRVTTTDAEIDAAIAEAKEYEPYRPVVVLAEYRPASDEFALKLKTGVRLLVPRHIIQGLETATKADLRTIEITLHGSALRWPTLDVDHYFPSWMLGYFGSRRWMLALGEKNRARPAAKSKVLRKVSRKRVKPRKKAA